MAKISDHEHDIHDASSEGIVGLPDWTSEAKRGPPIEIGCCFDRLIFSGLYTSEGRANT